MKFKLFMFTTTPAVLTLVGSMATLLSTLISLLASNPALQIGIVAGILILIGVIVVFWMYMGITTLVLQKKIENKKEKYLEEESDQLMNETKESEGKTKSKKKTKKKVTKKYRTKKHFKTRNDDKCDAQHNSTTKRNKPSCNEALGISNSDKRFEPIWGASGCINYYTDIGAGGTAAGTARSRTLTQYSLLYIQFL